MKPAYTRLAIRDLSLGLKDFSLAAYLAWEDIRLRYVRTMLGPWWIVLTTGIWFAVMGFVMAHLFGQTIHDYLPYVFSGLLVWALISTSINESSQVLVVAAPLITSFSLPIFTHYIRFVLRNYIIFLHNVLILVLVFVFFPPDFTAASWLVIPGLLLNMVILTGAAIILSFANIRYRDTHLAVVSAMQVLPFVTPIFWKKEMLKDNGWIADVNPFYHMINVVRAPLLGQYPSCLSWAVTGAVAIIVMTTAFAFFIRYRHRIIFWL